MAKQHFLYVLLGYKIRSYCDKHDISYKELSIYVSDYAPMVCIACYSVNYWMDSSGEKDWVCLDCGARWNSEDYHGRKD